MTTGERQWKLRVQSGIKDCSDKDNSGNDTSDKVIALQQATGLSALTLRVCIARGLETAESIQDFLFPRFEKLQNPLAIRDMDKAIDRLVAVKNLRQKIRIYGDYDVDGTTGAAL